MSDIKKQFPLLLKCGGCYKRFVYKQELGGIFICGVCCREICYKCKKKHIRLDVQGETICVQL